MLKLIVCLIVGCNDKLVHSGSWEYSDAKRNKIEKQVFQGNCNVYQCSRCGHQTVGVLRKNDIHV